MVDTVIKAGTKVYCYLTPFAISTYDIIPRGTPVTKWNEPLDRFNVLKKKDSKPVAEYFFNAEDWNLSPAQFTGDGVAGHETSEMAYVAPDSSWSDYFADAVRQMLEQSDFDGFYFDLPLPQENFDDPSNSPISRGTGSKKAQFRFWQRAISINVSTGCSGNTAWDGIRGLSATTCANSTRSAHSATWNFTERESNPKRHLNIPESGEEKQSKAPRGIRGENIQQKCTGIPCSTWRHTQHSLHCTATIRLYTGAWTKTTART